MKKKILMMLLMSVMMLTACGNKEEAAPSTEENTEADGTQERGPQYLKDYHAADYVTLGEYKGVEVVLAEPEVTEEDVESYIAYVLQNSPISTPVTDRAVEEGDIANIDYEGKLDGVAFEGGTAQGYDLAIGSGTFIPGFEDGIIGMNIGETKDVEATFPDPYQNNPDLAGKVATFTVTVNSISVQEIPELTDEYVAGLEMEECKTVDEYRAYMKEILLEQRMASYEDEKENLVITAITENTEFQEPPAGLVDRMNATLVGYVESYAGMYGMDAGSYVAAVYGGTAEEYEATLLEEAKLVAQQYLMMQAIADAEGLTVSDEELNTMLSEEAAAYGYESADAYKEVIDVEAYREYLMSENVLTFITENAVAKAE